MFTYTKNPVYITNVMSFLVNGNEICFLLKSKQVILITLLNKLREEGFKIEMDDFGKGYSSLNTLGTLPLDII